MSKKLWRVISSADGVDEEYASLDEALQEAGKVLALWRDQACDEGEWDEDVEGLEVHLVTHAARITKRDQDERGESVEYGIVENTAELTQLRADLAMWKNKSHSPLDTH